MYPRQKKVLSLLLACAACFYLPSFHNGITLHAAAEEMLQPIQENASLSTIDSPAADALNESVANGLLASFDPTAFVAIDVDESMLDYYYMEADEIEQFYGAPEEMLNAPTLELLDFFLHTDFMRHRLAHESASSSAAIASLNDGFFFQHEAFVELISRADLVSTIKTYATRFFFLSDDSADTSTDDFLLQKFQKFLNQSTVSELVSQTVTANTITYPCLS